MLRRGTYSVVACDPGTGTVGVAVQSHWFAVGPVVPWARAGVGAVATQSVAEPSYGPRLLDRLEQGQAPADALRDALVEDEAADVRQVAVVDVTGRVAVHTGARCIAHAGHEQLDHAAVQANMMTSPAVWPAMAQAYDRASGPLTRRLMAALHAAEAQGGDARGRQSSAILVVPPAGVPGRSIVDLRVDDDPEPLEQLDRLLDLHDAYEQATAGDDLTAQGRLDEAAERYERASALAPDSHELLFWSGLAAAQNGDLPTALERVDRAIALQPGWRELLDRLEPDIAPGAAPVRAALEARS